MRLACLAILAFIVGAAPGHAQSCPTQRTVDTAYSAAVEAYRNAGAMPAPERNQRSDRLAAATILKWSFQGLEAATRDAPGAFQLARCYDRGQCGFARREDIARPLYAQISRDQIGQTALPAGMPRFPSQPAMDWARTILGCEIVRDYSIARTVQPDLRPRTIYERLDAPAPTVTRRTVRTVTSPQTSGTAEPFDLEAYRRQQTGMAIPREQRAGPQPEPRSETPTAPIDDFFATPADRETPATTPVDPPERLPETSPVSDTEAPETPESVEPLEAEDLPAAPLPPEEAPEDPLPAERADDMFADADAALKDGDRSAIPDLEALCEEDYARACRSLLRAYDEGQFASSRADFLRVTGRGCELGDVELCRIAALEHGRLISEGDQEKLVTYGRKACELGEADFCASVADCLNSGQCGEADPKLTRSLYQSACDLGASSKCYEFGRMVLFGNGGETNQKLARDSLEQACREGDSAPGCDLLAIMQSVGDGGPRAVSRAADNARKSCDGGYAGGCATLASLLADDVLGADWSRIRGLLQKACNGDVARACYSLSSLQADGIGGATETERAIENRQKACRLGKQDAC